MVKRLIILVGILLTTSAQAQTSIVYQVALLESLSGLQGLATNVQYESGISARFDKMGSVRASLSEALPLVKVTIKSFKETLMFVHSDIIARSGTTLDAVGFGLNSEKRPTPKPVNVTVGTVAPIAHHGIFLNVVSGTTAITHGRVGSGTLEAQVGGYTTF